MNNAQQKEFNQQCLYTALMELMKEKKFEKISIGELCDRAGVSRMTYYRSYNSKEDILLQHLDESFTDFMHRIEAIPDPTAYDISLVFFEYWKNEEKSFLLTVMRSRLTAQITEKFYHYLDTTLEIVVPKKNVPIYVKSFLSGGLCKMLFDWVRYGFKDSPQSMAVFLTAGNDALMNLVEL